MKISSYLLCVLLIISCSPTKKEESSATDSTIIARDSLIISSETSSANEEPASEEIISSETYGFTGTTNNFPFFDMASFTEDSLESEVNNAMGELLQSYDTLSFETVRSMYSWERSYVARGQEGEGFNSTENEEETRTWYFDDKANLRAISIEYKDGPAFSTTKTSFYLFDNDSLIAFSEYILYEDEVTTTDQKRIIKSNCPRCGYSINYGGGSDQVKHQEQSELITKQQELDLSIDEFIQLVKSKKGMAKKEEDALIFSVNRTKEGKKEDKSQTISYPVKFTISKNLYADYFDKN